MLARVPWTPTLKAEAKPRPRQLNRDKRRHLVETVARLMKTAKESGAAATLLNFEGPCRHGLRSRLTLEGWGWQDADDMAADIVATALRQIGAQRPTWAEGQPEWAQQGAGALIERTRCIRCHSPLPEGHFKFCCELCASAHQVAIGRMRDADERKAYDIAAGR
jgi:hypothetical protein